MPMHIRSHPESDHPPIGLPYPLYRLPHPIHILPHPIHVHAGQFRVLSRTGGRNRLMPWEAGLKDTVLTHPGETVNVAVRFDRYPGLFLFHCHNLEHEDMGMMANFRVE